jgi:hypothetical protein
MGAFDFCKSAAPILGLVGYVILGIKIVVPIILIIMGMMDLAKAVTSKDDKEIKNAQMLLVRRAIAAVIVFLVVTAVTIVMDLIKSEDWKACKPCLLHPTTAACEFNPE